MQKPDNKSLKDFLIEKVADDLQFPLDIVEAVIGWSYKSANEATKSHKTIELSGIGKLMLSQGKLKKRLLSLESMERNMQNDPRLPMVLETIKNLKEKVNGDISHSGRLEESSFSTSKA